MRQHFVEAASTFCRRGFDNLSTRLGQLLHRKGIKKPERLSSYFSLKRHSSKGNLIHMQRVLQSTQSGLQSWSHLSLNSLQMKDYSRENRIAETNFIFGTTSNNRCGSYGIVCSNKENSKNVNTLLLTNNREIINLTQILPKLQEFKT